MPILEAYQHGFEESPEAILGFVHDDVVCLEDGWDMRVLKEFEDSNVGLVGLGGALGLGDEDIYKTPYRLSQLARHTFLSNMREAEAHGQRFTGDCDVACFDGFALFVRRKVLEGSKWWLNTIGPEGRVLEQCGSGWPVGTPVNYFMYDAWISCEARRQGWKSRLVGVECDHLGGKSTGLGQVMDGRDFEKAHEYIYETCRDVLPMRVK
jgi:hypothetical protein